MAPAAKVLIASLCLVFVSFVAQAESKKVVCYFGSWSVYRPGNGKFDVEDIDPFICTHVMYGFVGLGPDARVKVWDPWNDLYDNWGKGAFNRFVALKQKNPALKTLVAIGGWNDGSEKYSQILSDPAKRTIFVQDASAFVRKYGFDGLDLDWEYPNQRGGVYSDINVFSELIRELRIEFDRYGLLLTAAVASAEVSFSKSYDVPTISSYLDFINVMAYDFHGAWENVTGHNAPLYSAAALKGTEFEGFSVNSGVQAWLRYGAPAEKLVMGVGLYGRTFSVSSPSCITPRCPVTGGAPAGQWTREAGILGYNEVCLIEKQAGTAKYWDDEAKAPYLVNGNTWIGYDSEETVQMKVDYIKQNRLGGGMVWSIDTDDFRGSCGRGVFPLLTILNRGLVGYTDPSPAPSTSTSAPATTTTSAPVTTTTSAPVTSTTSAPATSTTSAPAATTTTSAPATTAAPSGQICTGEGYVRDANDCKVFYQCTAYQGGYKYTKFTCGKGLAFDTNLNVCNFESEVQC